MPLPVRTLSSTPYSAPQPGNQNAGGGLFGGPNINPNLGFGSTTYTPPPTLANPAGGGTAGMTLPNGQPAAAPAPSAAGPQYGTGFTRGAAGWQPTTLTQNPGESIYDYGIRAGLDPRDAMSLITLNMTGGGNMSHQQLVNNYMNVGPIDPRWGQQGVTSPAGYVGGKGDPLSPQMAAGAGGGRTTLGGVASGQPPNFGGDMVQGGPGQSNQPGNQGGAPGFSQSPGNFTGGMTPQDYINPAAAWARGEGLKGVQGTYAGSPYGLNSGAAMKGIGDYLTGSSLNQAWQPGFQNYMQDKGFNYGVASGDRAFNYQAQLNDQTIPFQQQMQMANLGINGAYGGADIASKLAAIISQNALGAGQVGASGTVGGNNAITGALQQIIQNGMQMGGPQGQFWQQLMAQMNGMPQGH